MPFLFFISGTYVAITFIWRMETCLVYNHPPGYVSLAKRNVKLIICSASAIFAAFAHVEDPIFLILLSHREHKILRGEQKGILFFLTLLLPWWIKILGPEKTRHSPSCSSRNRPSNVSTGGKSGKSIQK
jgi:hypothetical protein